MVFRSIRSARFLVRVHSGPLARLRDGRLVVSFREVDLSDEVPVAHGWDVVECWPRSWVCLRGRWVQWFS